MIQKNFEWQLAGLKRINRPEAAAACANIARSMKVFGEQYPALIKLSGRGSVAFAEAGFRTLDQEG